MQFALVPGAQARRKRLSYRSTALYAAAWTAGHSVFKVRPLNPYSMAALQRIDPLLSRVPAPRGTQVERVSFDGFEAEWVRPRKATGDGAVLYFHGGGFFFGGLNTHRFGIAAISSSSGLPAFSVAYRQMPQAPIRTSVADCLTAYQHLLGQGIAPEKIVFAGDSAGGYLTFATALAAREAGLPMPAGIAASSPLLDIDCTNRLEHANFRRDTYIPANWIRALSDFWNGHPEAPEPPISPVNEDLTGMPPSLIMAAESEILLCDSEFMAQRLWEHGAECKLQVWNRQVHAFPVLGHLTPETRTAVEQIGTFVRERVGND